MTTLTPNVKNIHNTLGHTTFDESNMLTSNLASTRIISWEEINFPESKTIRNVVPPTPIINRSVDQIMETREGDVILNFRGGNPQFSRSLSTRHGSLPYRVFIPSNSVKAIYSCK